MSPRRCVEPECDEFPDATWWRCTPHQDALEADVPSRDRCPEWNCPDLSVEDRRDGRTCPDHLCTCALNPTDRQVEL